MSLAGSRPRRRTIAANFKRAAVYVDKILKGRQASRSAGGAADEVRVRDQPEDSEADRRDDCAGGAGAREQVDQMTEVRSQKSDRDLLKNSPFILREPQDERRSG